MSYLDGFIAIIHGVFQSDVEVPKGSIVDFAHVFLTTRRERWSFHQHKFGDKYDVFGLI